MGREFFSRDVKEEMQALTSSFEVVNNTTIKLATNNKDNSYNIKRTPHSTFREKPNLTPTNAILGMPAAKPADTAPKLS